MTVPLVPAPSKTRAVTFTAPCVCGLDVTWTATPEGATPDCTCEPTETAA